VTIRGTLALISDDEIYTCDCCGEEIVVPIDLFEGRDQEYVEDCPVCCCPNVIHVTIDEDGHATIRSKPLEQ
jgi:hypothetical protein